MVEPRVGGASSRSRIFRQAVLTAFVAAGTLAFAASPAGAQKNSKPAADAPWDLGKVPAGKRYPTTAAAHNVNCKGAHDFELSFEGDAAALFTFKDTNIVRGVGPGATKSVDVYLDARTAAPGVYNGGAIVQKCLTCPPKCQPHVQRRAIHLTLTGDGQDGGTTTGTQGGGASGGGSESGGGSSTGGGTATRPGGPGTRTGSGGGPGTTATGGGGGGPTGAPPTDSDQPVRRCGGDVTEAFAEILQRAAARIRKLPFDEQWGDRRETFKRRNPIVLLPDELDATAGCPLSGECRATVTFFGECVSRSAPEEVLKGFVERMFGYRHDYDAPQLFGQYVPETEDEVRTRSARGLGAAFGEHFFSNQSSNFLGDGKVEKWNDGLGDLDEFRATADSIEMAIEMGTLGARFEACPICETKLGFAADWSKETWTLSDGSRVEPP